MIPQENLSGLEEELNEDIQNLCTAMFEEGRIGEVLELTELTGVESLIDEGTMRKKHSGSMYDDFRYIDWLQKEYTEYFEGDCLDDILGLYESTGVLPNKKLLKKYPEYAKYLGDSQ